jgi:hypothetical protein
VTSAPSSPDHAEGRLPTFLVIGAPKAGTTSLHDYLRRHPDVYMPTRKEPDFFSDDAAWQGGMRSYARLFRSAGDAVAVGEASTSYSRYPHVPNVPERIASVLPEVRLVYLVRHPIERMISQYRFRRSKGWEDRPIDVALSSDPTYLDPSRYAMQLERYLRSFTEHQILVVRSEELRADPASVMAEVFAFIGVDPDAAAVRERRLNASEAGTLRPAPHRVRDVVRRTPGYRRLVDSLPSAVRSGIVRPFVARRGPAPIPSRETVRRLEELLLADADRLRSLVGPELDVWRRR